MAQVEELVSRLEVRNPNSIVTEVSDLRVTVSKTRGYRSCHAIDINPVTLQSQFSVNMVIPHG